MMKERLLGEWTILVFARVAALLTVPSQRMPETVPCTGRQHYDRCLFIKKSVPQGKLPVGLLHLLFISTGFHTQQLKRVLHGCQLHLHTYQPCLKAAAMKGLFVVGDSTFLDNEPDENRSSAAQAPPSAVFASVHHPCQDFRPRIRAAMQVEACNIRSYSVSTIACVGATF
jgi:hypothetical protein